MADLAPARPSPLAPAFPGAGDGAPILERVRTFASQEPVRKALPTFLVLSALGAAALAYATLSPVTQRTLYSDLGDADRGAVVSMLEGAGIDYTIDNATGRLSVPDEDYYRARMLVAADSAVGTPQGGMEMLDAMPLGASRTLEGERLRHARERELMLTISEIDAVESVRVHLAEAERSAFVRDAVPPSASVMLTLARGRTLSEDQVRAIANLVAASVSGLDVGAVRIVDQAGRLLSDPHKAVDDRFALQAQMEQKLRSQLDHLLTPMFGAGNFSGEIQVELDMDEVTRASESYGREGSLRSESVQRSEALAAPTAGGIPGALSNSPPDDPTTAERAPVGGTPPQAQQPDRSGEMAATRNWDLDREVAVANSSPGQVKRLSVAVALSAEAMKDVKASDIPEIEKLIGSAVGVNEARGDRVAVVIRPFEKVESSEPLFYETEWFARLVRHGTALLAVLMVLLLAVRPLIKALRRKSEPVTPLLASGDDGEGGMAPDAVLSGDASAADVVEKIARRDRLDQKVLLARQIVADQPDSAVAALRQMLAEDRAAPLAEGART